MEQKLWTSRPDQKRSGGAEPHEHISPFRRRHNPTRRSIYEQRQEMIHLQNPMLKLNTRQIRNIGSIGRHNRSQILKGTIHRIAC